jgi:hypothetical protein
MMFFDEMAQPRTTYYYRVCAVDDAGQKGPFSQEAFMRMKDPDRPFGSVAAQSIYSCLYGPWNPAMNGIPWQSSPWMSKPYGGGVKDKPLDVWWSVEFPAGTTLQLKGVKIVVGAPILRSFLVQVREAEQWKTMGEVKNAKVGETTVAFPRVVAVHAFRIFVPAAELPKSDRIESDGIVRIDRVLLTLADGKELPPSEVFASGEYPRRLQTR